MNQHVRSLQKPINRVSVWTPWGSLPAAPANSEPRLFSRVPDGRASRAAFLEHLHRRNRATPIGDEDDTSDCDLRIRSAS